MQKMNENDESVESYTRKRVEASPLNSFVINHVSQGSGNGNSFNTLDRPEFRKPTKEVHRTSNFEI